jgi:alanine-glyoxylate transaminase/serine-glyoxylate transaminase/serine-pyruvate transaminase
MGHTSNPKNVLFCLAALERVLSDMRAPIERGKAVDAAGAALS